MIAGLRVSSGRPMTYGNSPGQTTAAASIATEGRWGESCAAGCAVAPGSLRPREADAQKPRLDAGATFIAVGSEPVDAQPNRARRGQPDTGGGVQDRAGLRSVAGGPGRRTHQRAKDRRDPRRRPLVPVPRRSAGPDSHAVAAAPGKGRRVLRADAA